MLSLVHCHVACRSVPNLGTTLACQGSLRTGWAQHTSSVASIMYLSCFGLAYGLAHTGTQADSLKKSATLAWDQLLEGGVLLLNLSKSKV